MLCLFGLVVRWFRRICGRRVVRVIVLVVRGLRFGLGWRRRIGCGWGGGGLVVGSPVGRCWRVWRPVPGMVVGRGTQAPGRDEVPGCRVSGRACSWSELRRVG